MCSHPNGLPLKHHVFRHHNGTPVCPQTPTQVVTVAVGRPGTFSYRERQAVEFNFPLRDCRRTMAGEKNTGCSIFSLLVRKETLSVCFQTVEASAFGAMSSVGWRGVAIHALDQILPHAWCAQPSSFSSASSSASCCTLLELPPLLFP
jgi:hypothetical protein